MNIRPFLKQHAAALFPLLLSLALICSRYATVALTMDGVTYLQISRNILHGKGLGWQALWASPFYSILVAAVSFVGGIDDMLQAATVVSVLMGFLLVGAVYFLAYQIFDRKVALISATLAAISPHLLRVTFSDETEITYTFFLTLSLALLTLAFKRDSRVFPALAGTSFALAYLSRSEGFLVMALILGGGALFQGRNLLRSGFFKKAVICSMLFFLVASPYLFFLKENYGKWTISPKASYVMLWMKCFTYHDNDRGEEGNEELWGLSDSGKLNWQEPRGVKDLIDFLGSHPEKSVAVYLNDLSHEIPGRIPNGSGMADFPQVFPVYLALLGLFAAFLPWGPLGREKKAVLIAPFALLFILPVFTDGWWKYLVPYLPLVIILAAKGFSGAVATLAQKIGTARAGTLEHSLLFLGVLSVGWLFTAPLHPKPQPRSQSAAAPSSAPSKKDLERSEAKKAAEYGLRLLGPGNNYMISWSPLVYYLNGSWTARPVAELPRQLRYARQNGADYYVLDAVIEDVSLLDLPGMQMVGLYISQITSLKVGFYRIPPAYY